MSKERSDNLVLFLSGRESNYPRNQMIIAALQNSYHTEVISSQRDDISRGSFYCIILQSIKCSIKALKVSSFQSTNLSLLDSLGNLYFYLFLLLPKSPWSLIFLSQRTTL